MLLNFTSPGFIEVWRDGARVSRHRQEREAIQSILAHCEGKESGRYEVRFPTVTVNYTAPAPVAPPVVTGAIDGGGAIDTTAKTGSVAGSAAAWIPR